MVDLSKIESPAPNNISGPPYWTEQEDGRKVCKILLTHSSITLYQKCKWNYFARTFWQLRPVEKKETLYLGGAFHDGVEAYFNESKEPLDDAALMAAMDAIDGRLGPIESGKDAMIKGMLKGFIRWGAAKSPYRLIRQEEEFLHKFPEAPDFEHEGIHYEFWLSGKVDSIMNHRDYPNKTWMGEWKTCMNFQDFISHIKVSNQPWQYMLLYYLKHGAFPEGTVYRIAKKSMIRQKKTESIDDFRERYLAEYEEKWQEMFMEEVVFFDPHRLDQHVDLLNGIALDMRNTIRDSLWTRNRGSCFQYNSPCSYMSLCNARDKSSFEVIAEQGYEYARANEELSDATASAK